MDDLISGLGATIDAVLQPIVPSGKPCALVGFPNHTNVGDSAIWLGERNYLGRQGMSVVYACDTKMYSQEQLRAQLKDGIILLHGGGNLGDLWPDHQRLRENVIKAFPGKTIVQLPQTIHFKERASLARAKAVFDRHPDLTILVRDQRSLELARNEFRTPSLLCPDMALTLGMLERPNSPKQDILCLLRTDAESSGYASGSSLPDGYAADWLEEEDSTRLRFQRRFQGWLSMQRCRHPRLWRGSCPLTSRILLHLWDGIASERLSRGCRLLSKARIVITDRLHGHLLCLLLGIPHVVLDNSYGKVRSFFETWTRDCELAVWADSPQEAFGKAEALLEDWNNQRIASPAPHETGESASNAVF